MMWNFLIPIHILKQWMFGCQWTQTVTQVQNILSTGASLEEDQVKFLFLFKKQKLQELSRFIVSNACETNSRICFVQKSNKMEDVSEKYSINLIWIHFPVLSFTLILTCLEIFNFFPDIYRYISVNSQWNVENLQETFF